MNSIPRCVCGANSFKSEGGSFGGGTVQENWYRCEACSRHCVRLQHYMAVLAFPAERISDFSKPCLVYLNGSLRSVMKQYSAAIERIREVIETESWNLNCDLVGVPRDVKFRWIEERGRSLQCLDGSYIDSELVERLDMLNSEQVPVRGSNLILPPILPQVPDCLVMYVQRKEEWVLVDREASSKLCVSGVSQ